MQKLLRNLSGCAGFVFLLGFGLAAQAAEIRFVSTVALQAILEDLGPKFERASGHKLAVEHRLHAEVVKRAQSAEPIDVVIVNQAAGEGLVKSGRATAGNVTVLATSSMAIAVRKGAPKPDISTEDALRRALLAARSVSFSNPSSGQATGVHFSKVLDRLGIADTMKSRSVFPVPPVLVGELVAKGEAELGAHQLQELLPVAGIDIVGPLPGDLQYTLTYSVVILNGAKDPDAAQALVRFLRTPEAAAVIRAKGNEPAR
jgi:molybdate transport system substrate-binding protein